MTTTIQRSSATDIVLNKLKEVKILQLLNEDTNKILFIGDRAILAYLGEHLQERKPQASFNCIEFDLNHSESFWQELEEKQEYISNNIETVIVASLKHEQQIYKQINQKLDLKILLLFDEIFINLVTQRNIFDSVPKNFTPPKISYCILSTPRSGSTMFCDALTSTRLAGFPREHLREPSLALEVQGNFDSDRYIRAIKSLHTTPNSVFGTKLISHFIERYLSVTNSELNPLHYFDKFIYLIRRDKVAQAVSLFMAHKSGVWKISQAEKLSDYQDKISNNTISQDDLEKVHQLHNRLLEEEQFLEQSCQQNNIEPLTIYYEDLTADLHNNIRKVLCHLNVINEQDNSPIQISIREKKLGTQLSQEIIKQYKQKFS